jgi:hypothetical protein
MERRGWGWRYHSVVASKQGYVELSVSHGGRSEVLQNQFHYAGALLVKKGSETCASKGVGTIQNSLRGGLGVSHAVEDGCHF